MIYGNRFPAKGPRKGPWEACFPNDAYNRSWGYCVPGIGAAGTVSAVGAVNAFWRGYGPIQWIFHFQAVLPWVRFDCEDQNRLKGQGTQLCSTEAG